MKLFSRLKDYNNLLEEILDKKTFSSMAKSLYLSMIYKLEVSYKDYSQVKITSITKDDFLMNLLQIINNYCDNVKLVEPDSVKSQLLTKNNVRAVTNIKERSIMSYPTELAMLYGICDIEPKYFFIKNDFMFKNIFQKVLVYGYKQNTMEILKNFNGWSWDINPNENIDYTSNIIYQNLMIMMGEDFLYEWRTDNKGKKDYLAKLKYSIKNITGNDEYYTSLCKILYIISKKIKKENLTKEITIKELQYKEFCLQSDEFKKENIKQFDKLKVFHEIYENKNTEYEELVNLQKHFLEFMNKKIEKISTRDEILEVIYELRWYQNILFFKGVFVKDYNEIKVLIENTIKLLITKACKLGVLKIISMNIDTNFEILKYILDTKIINLEDIKIYIKVDKNDIYTKVYDKDIFEKQGKIKFSGDKKDISIRKKKMINIFN